MIYTAFILADFVITFIAGQCTTRTFIQTCVSCKSSPECGANSDMDGGDVSYCRSVCLAKTPYDCNMVEVQLSSGTCFYFPTCTYVSFVDSHLFTTVRKTCTSDCLEVEVARHSQQRGTCNELSSHYSISSVDKCLSLCLDTAYCRGATYSITQTCDLHTCNTWVLGGNDFTYMQLKCAGETTTTTKPTTTSIQTTSAIDPTSPTILLTSTEIGQLPEVPAQSSSAVTAQPTTSRLLTSAWITSPLSSVITRPLQTTSNIKSVSTISTNTRKSPTFSTFLFTSQMTPIKTQSPMNKSMSTTTKLIRKTSAQTSPFCLSLAATTPTVTSMFLTESLITSIMRTPTSDKSTVPITPAFTIAVGTQRSVTSTFKTPTSVASTYMSPVTNSPISLTSSKSAKTLMPQSVSLLETDFGLTTYKAPQPSSEQTASADSPLASMSTSDNTMAPTVKEDVRNYVGFFENTINIAVFASLGGVVIVMGMGYGMWQLIIRKGTSVR